MCYYCRWQEAEDFEEELEQEELLAHQVLVVSPVSVVREDLQGHQDHVVLLDQMDNPDHRVHLDSRVLQGSRLDHLVDAEIQDGRDSLVLLVPLDRRAAGEELVSEETLV